MQFVPRNGSKFTFIYFRNDDANSKALLDSEYLSRSFRMLFFGSILLLNECTNSDQHTVGALNWTAAEAAEPLQDYTISLVGYKFAGFFFPKKIRILVGPRFSM
jgi:hypothetical protein